MRAASFHQVIVNTKQALDPRRLATLDDAELLQRLLLGDSAVLEAIMQRHGSMVTSAARQILKDAADVEDVFQASFIVLLKSAHKIQKGRSLGSWLFGVAHRLAVHARCRKTKQQMREQNTGDLPEHAVQPDDLSWREATALLHEELDRMPERLRLPLLLCHLEGKSRDEAAAELGISAGSVKGLLERGRAKLKVRLEKRGIAFSVGLLGTLAAEGTTPPTGWVDSTVNAVVNASVRPTVQQLAHGVLPMSKFLKMTLAASLFVLASLLSIVTYMYAEVGASEKETPVAQKKENPPPGDKPAGNTFVIAGKVVGPDGKPMANVALYVPILLKEEPTSEKDISVKEVGRSGADGSFRIEVKKSLVSRFLYARANGLAFAWDEFADMKDRDNITLKLEKELVISGRMVDTEGKPVVGASFRVQSIRRSGTGDGKLDNVLAEYKKDWRRALKRDMVPVLAPFDDLDPLQKTDKDGNYKIYGVPLDCVVMIQASSPDGSQSVFHVVTREGFDPKPYNESAYNQVPESLRFPGQPAVLYGPKADLVLPLGRVIEGIVTDEDGKPLAGIGVSTGDHYAGQMLAVSDKEGRYRLTGVRKQKQYLVHASMRENKESRYLMWTGRIDDTEGYGPMTHDIQLTKGVVVTGKLIDRETGKGAFGHIRTAPLAGNEFFEKKAGYRGYNGNRTSFQSKPDGTFRVLAIPGKSIIMVQADEGPGTTRNSVQPYLTAKPDPDFKDLFKKNGDEYYIATANRSTEFTGLNQALKIIDIPADATEFKVDLYLERGKTVQINVVDADGKPLTKNVVSGVAANFPFVHEMDESSFKAVALDPEQPRQMIVVNPERKLAGSVMLKGDEKEAVTVKLQPLGTLTGRLVDLDGQPRVGVNVGPRGRGRALGDLYREAFGIKADVLTDADGKFTMDLIIPGVDIFLGLSKGKEYYVGEKGIGGRKVESGKTVDYGTLKIKKAE